MAPVAFIFAPLETYDCLKRRSGRCGYRRLMRGSSYWVPPNCQMSIIAKTLLVTDCHPALPRDTRILGVSQRPPVNLVVLVGPTEHNLVPVVEAPANALKPLPQLLCVNL